MRLTKRKITPWHLPFHPVRQRTYDPELIVLTTKFVRARDLLMTPLWQIAPVTDDGREAILREAVRDLEPALVEGWRVRLRKEDEDVALVLKVKDHFLHGRLVSETPVPVPMSWRHNVLVVMRDRVIAVWGADASHGFGHLADILLGTVPAQADEEPADPAPEEPVPEEDLEFLGLVARPFVARPIQE